jgi:hypothetical protein
MEDGRSNEYKYESNSRVNDYNKMTNGDDEDR